MILLWILIALLTASLMEYIIHRFFLHERRIHSLWHEHVVLHHSRFYRVFDHEPDEKGKFINLSFSVLTTLGFCILFSWVYFIDLTGGFIFTATIVLHNIGWNLFHSEMHLDKKHFFSDWGIFHYLKFHHFLHHRHVDKNYNVLLPLFDYVFFTKATPSFKDKLAWNSLKSNQ